MDKLRSDKWFIINFPILPDKLLQNVASFSSILFTFYFLDLCLFFYLEYDGWQICILLTVKVFLLIFAHYLQLSPAGLQLSPAGISIFGSIFSLGVNEFNAGQ